MKNAPAGDLNLQAGSHRVQVPGVQGISGQHMGETAEDALKRMRMRSWRRGTKEMDLVLGPFADARLADLSASMLAAYDALLAENDQDLMQWVLGRSAPPDRFAALIARIAAHARERPLRGL